MILVEEHTYPSSMAHWIPTGCKAVPLKMDGEGILAKELDEVLVEWEDRYPGQKKPHV
jgi:aromatic amino acid aminotransferase I